MSGANGSYSRVSVGVGSDWRVRCLTVAGHSPVLDIDAGEIEISLSLAGQEIRASAVEFAAELAREVGRYLHTRTRKGLRKRVFKDLHTD